MKVGKTFYARNRREWRAWLARHHKTAPEIWLIYYKKHSGKPRVSYNDAVDEALCYGWIDSTLKPIDADCYTQRFSPRRPTSRLSEMNRERVRRLIAARRMTRAGVERLRHVFDHTKDTKPVTWRRTKSRPPSPPCRAPRARDGSGSDTRRSERHGPSARRTVRPWI